MQAPGVTVVTDLAQLKSLYEVFAMSIETQVAVAHCRFEWDEFDGDIDIWSLTIQTDTAGVLKELETQAEVYHLAGPSPQHTSSVPVVTLTEVVTEVVRVSPSEAAWQQGRWIYQDPSPKQLRTMFKEVSDELVAAVLDAWKPQTAQDSKSLSVGGHQGRLCVCALQILYWLREKTLSDAASKAEQIVKDIEETDRWKHKSAIVIKEEQGKTSFGVRVHEEHFAKTKQQEGQDARPLWVVRGASASWTSEDLQDVLDQLRWPAQIVRTMGPRAYLIRGRSPAIDEPLPKKPKAEGEADILRQVFVDLRQQNQQLQQQLNCCAYATGGHAHTTGGAQPISTEELR
eukprot:2746036-Amphidinium_carterae.2